jgi:hypothetical protein
MVEQEKIAPFTPIVQPQEQTGHVARDDQQLLNPTTPAGVSHFEFGFDPLLALKIRPDKGGKRAKAVFGRRRGLRAPLRT